MKTELGMACTCIGFGWAALGVADIIYAYAGSNALRAGIDFAMFVLPGLGLTFYGFARNPTRRPVRTNERRTWEDAQ